MEHQKFVTAVIQALGGIVEPIEYGLCQVLIPNEYISYFSGKSEMLLSFDYEVASENEDSEFVTFGSFILDQVIELATKIPKSMIRYINVDKLAVYRPEEKIKNYLGQEYERAKISILDEKSVYGIWCLFLFRMVYTSDERIEQTKEIWINMVNGKNDEDMAKSNANLFYEEKSTEKLPICCEMNFQNAFEIGYKYAKTESTNIANSMTKEVELNKEIERIKGYYEQLVLENKKAMKRKNISEEHLKKLIEKEKIMKLEQEKQIYEMKNKLKYQLNIWLDQGITYFVPLIAYHIEIEHQREKKEKIIYYNTVTKKFF